MQKQLIAEHTRLVLNINVWKMIMDIEYITKIEKFNGYCFSMGFFQSYLIEKEYTNTLKGH